MNATRSCALCSAPDLTEGARLQCYSEGVSNMLLILVLHTLGIVVSTDLSLVFFVCSMSFGQYRSPLEALDFVLHRALATSILLQRLSYIAEFLLTHQL